MNYGMMQAVEFGDIYRIKCLVNENEFLNNDVIRNLSFLYSCKLGRIDAAKILLDYANPNCRYADGQTALMLLVNKSSGISEQLKFLKELLKKGCDVNLVDYCGKNVIHWAAIADALWAIRILIEHGCNFNSVDILGFTPLMYAAKMNNASIITLLLHRGADISKNSKQHGSAMHVAIRYNSLDALRQLVLFCRHLNILDSRNQVPIDIAVMRNSIESVKILLQANKEIELNRRPSFAPFRTPLEEACLKNNLEIVQLLLDSKADPNYSLEFAFQFDNQHNNRAKPIAPLILAIRHCNEKMVDLLLYHGADPNVKCPKNPGSEILTTPFSLATELKDVGIMEKISKKQQELDNTNEVPVHLKYDIKEGIKISLISEAFDIAGKLLYQWFNTFNDKSYFIDELFKICQHNGIPVIFNLFNESFLHAYIMKDITGAIKSLIPHIINGNVLKRLMDHKLLILLNENRFGPSMQKYRENWMFFIHFIKYYTEVTIDLENDDIIEFLNNYIYQFFMSKKSHIQNIILKKFNMITSIFNQRSIRKSIHSTKVIKAILMSQSPYALETLVNCQFNEELAFWDASSVNQLNPFDVCELALFFDNIDAALVLNITSNISLKCVWEYQSLPYKPDIFNEELEYNDSSKIDALKKLCRTVKPLKALCKYQIRRNLLLNELTNPLQDLLPNQYQEELCLNLSNYIDEFESKPPYNSTIDNQDHHYIIIYSSLFKWIYCDADDFQLTDY